jgi:putative ABC transport system ATP-binding protein
LKVVPTILAREIGFSYGAKRARGSILRSLSLAVAPGEVAVVTGASGAGKTTLLTLCGALRSIQDGELYVLGRDLRGLGVAEQCAIRSLIGFIFQSHNLIEALTARQNVMMSVLDRAQPGDFSKCAADKLASLGLSAKADAFPEALSGGEKQRVAVARALIRNPRLILADEPTASLDDRSAGLVKEAIANAARTTSCAVLVVTHDPRLFDIADRVLHLVDGSLSEG